MSVKLHFSSIEIEIFVEKCSSTKNMLEYVCEW